MKKIRKTLSIIKIRWAEVVLILVLSCSPRVLDMFVARVLPTLRASSMWSVFLLLKCSIYICAYIILYGFVRTAYLEGSKRQVIPTLLRVGKQFFWRMLSLAILASVLLLSFGYLIFFVSGHAIPFRLCLVLTSLIFIKPFLFIPAILIVLDCRVFSSFRNLNRFKLLDAKELVVLSLVFAGLSFFLKSPAQLASFGTAVDYMIAVILILLVEFVQLVIFLGAIRFVGSLGPPLDYSSVIPNLEGSSGERCNG